MLNTVEPLCAKHAQITTWECNDLARLPEASDEGTYAPIWVVSITNRKRRFDLLELRWQDLDLHRETIGVRCTPNHGNGAPSFGEPKSTAGRLNRYVALTSYLAARATISGRCSVETDTDLIFDHGNGGLLNPITLLDAFERLIVAAGAPRARFYDLCHTAATLTLSNEEHLRIVQERLGYSDVSMTLNR